MSVFWGFSFVRINKINSSFCDAIWSTFVVFKRCPINKHDYYLCLGQPVPLNINHITLISTFMVKVNTTTNIRWLHSVAEINGLRSKKKNWLFNSFNKVYLVAKIVMSQGHLNKKLAYSIFGHHMVSCGWRGW